MPTSKGKWRRGGVVRIRTVKIDGKNRKVYVMRRPGPKGGHTIVVKD